MRKGEALGNRTIVQPFAQQTQYLYLSGGKFAPVSATNDDWGAPGPASSRASSQSPTEGRPLGTGSVRVYLRNK